MSHQNKKYRRGLGLRLEMIAGMSLITAIFMMQPSAVEAKAVRGEDDLFGPVRSVIYKGGAWNSGNWAHGTTITQKIETYNPEGHKVESEEFYYRGEQIVPGSNKRSVYFYDEKSNTEEVLSYTEAGFRISKEVLTFDSEGRIKEVASYNHEGSPTRRVYEYDDIGNKTEIIFYKKTDDFVSMRMKHYLNKGRTDLVADDDSYEIESRAVNTYDKQGHLIGALIFKADGSLNYKWRLIYNTEGQRVRVSVYDSNGTIRLTESYSYEYDSEGNWTKQVISGWEFGKGSHDRLKVRTIEYY